MSVTNRNTQEPYLAQTWIEDESENKVTSPLMVLPPVQRIEAGSKSAVRVQVCYRISVSCRKTGRACSGSTCAKFHRAAISQTS
nr:fimbria/pilus periplasmic chaperone [Klebsiella michiganensis]